MYQTLSKYYDAFMDEIDYAVWTAYVVKLLGDKRKDGLDLACGTGRFTLRLAALGYRVTGVDLSPEMLTAAQNNALQSGVRVPFLQGSIESFRPIAPVSFVIAMCDGLNYVRNLTAAAKNLYAMLKPGGVLIFDISSEYKLKTVIGNHTFSDQRGDVTYIWHNRLNGKKNAVEMELTFFEKQGALYKKSSEKQIQYIHPQESVVSALKAAGFSDIKQYAGQTMRKPGGETERIHFRAEKRRQM